MSQTPPNDIPQALRNQLRLSRQSIYIVYQNVDAAYRNIEQLELLLTQHFERNQAAIDRSDEISEIRKIVGLLRTCNEKRKSPDGEVESNDPNKWRCGESSGGVCTGDGNERTTPAGDGGPVTDIITETLHLTDPLSIDFGPTRTGKPNGLLRIGNTCFANSLLQCLGTAFDPGQLQRLLGQAHIGNLSANEDDENDHELLSGESDITRQNERGPLPELFRVLESIRSGQDTTVNATPLVRKFAAVTGKSDYNGKEQDDPVWWLRELLFCLAEGATYTGGYQPVRNKPGDYIYALFRSHTAVFNICQDPTRDNKEYQSAMQDEWDLRVSPPNNTKYTLLRSQVKRNQQPQMITVTRLLEHLFARESNAEQDCRICGNKCGVERRRCLVDLPRCLILQFNRAQYDQANTREEHEQQGKLAYAVDFEDTLLDMSSFVDDESRQWVYRLRSVVFHKGTRYSEGHYFTATQTGTGDGSWWICNDTRVSQKRRPFNNSKDADAHLAFYERVDEDVSVQQLVAATAEEFSEPTGDSSHIQSNIESSRTGRIMVFEPMSDNNAGYTGEDHPSEDEVRQTK